MILRTARLDLVPVTSGIARADASNRAALPALLGAHVPPEWPPPLLADHLEEFAQKLELDTHPPRQHPFYWLLDERRDDSSARPGSNSACEPVRANPQPDPRRRPLAAHDQNDGPGRVLIGSGGFFDLGDGSWMIGYSVLDAYQRLGYATEAVSALVAWAFQRDPSPRTIVATTYPELVASIRVLEKNGFHFDGPGDEPRTIRYVREKRKRRSLENPGLTGPRP